MQKKTNTPSNFPKTQEFEASEVMETITSTNDSLTDRAEPLQEAADEKDLLSLFNKYSNLMSPNLDCLATEDAVIINEVSLEDISATYHVTAQQCITTALFNAGGNI